MGDFKSGASSEEQRGGERAKFSEGNFEIDRFESHGPRRAMLLRRERLSVRDSEIRSGRSSVDTSRKRNLGNSEFRIGRSSVC